MLLTDMGITTAHRAGVEDIVEKAWQKLRSAPNLSPSDRGKQMLEGLVQIWEQEIQSKNRNFTFDDRIFLIEGAQHFVSQWARVHDGRQLSAG